MKVKRTGISVQLDHAEIVEMLTEGLARRGVVKEGAACRCAGFEVDRDGNMASAWLEYDAMAEPDSTD